MERETEKITTPVGKIEITLKKWLTGGEKMAMVKIQPDGFIEWMLENIVVSPAIEVIKELHGKDFDFLLTRLQAVVSESTWTEAKKE